MSKFGCTCGNVISDVQCPNDVTGWLLSDKSSEEFFSAISDTIDAYLQHLADGDADGWRRKHFNNVYPSDLSGGSMIHDVLTGLFFDRTLKTMECDRCGRLWIQDKPDGNEYHPYSPDCDADARTKMLGYNTAHGDMKPD
ncbi:hypothetical protein Mal4_37570 [Maioricimonas rarisocia]|uniref:Uncharacterized protein n=1 Tax=Maioricimonas rarisocia TaxID=2528026 RepID=A0A517ZA96_9PLAN|nr:hypothetical protein [Maioricimonas rarisocia]QDU39412.1 hypothetical protein Mal4_37570 [Maioricimonas rarisocia]